MQSHEERADEMLRTMGGSLSESEQRNVLRRLILAEDKVVDLQAEVIGLRKCEAAAREAVEAVRAEKDREIERLRGELTEAYQTLGWYADESNYDDFDTADPADHGAFWGPAAATKDRGERARLALTSPNL